MASVRSQKMLNSLPQDTIWAKLNWLLTTYPDGIGPRYYSSSACSDKQTPHTRWIWDVLPPRSPKVLSYTQEEQNQEERGFDKASIL
jgi:hypothetical protein